MMDPVDGWLMALEGRPSAYIAAYYSKNPAHGLHIASKAYDALLIIGFLPIVPHTGFLLDAIRPRTSGFWYAYDLEILRRCDVLFVCDDEDTGRSEGVRREIEFAEKVGIPVLRGYDEARRYLVDMD